MGDVTERVVRQTHAIGLDRQRLARIMAGGTLEGTPKETLRQVREEMKRIANGGFVEVVNRRTGEIIRFKPTTYADLVYQTQMAMAEEAAAMQRYREAGIDLVRIIGSNSTNFCTRFVGKVYSLSGKHPVYPPFSILPGGGPPFHPRCTKRTVPFNERAATPEQLEKARPDPQTDQLHGKPPADAQREYTRRQREQEVTTRNAGGPGQSEVGSGNTEASNAATIQDPGATGNIRKRPAGKPPITADAGIATGLDGVDRPWPAVPDISASPSGTVVADMTLLTDPAARGYLHDLVSRFGDLLPPLRLTCAPSSPAQESSQLAVGAVMSYDPIGKVIVFRRKPARWSMLADLIRQAAESRLISTPHPAYLLLQEAAHLLHHQSIGDAALAAQMLRDFTGTITRRRVAASVSRRALHSEAEFVAEVFAGLRTGRSFSQAVMELYQSLGGPG